MMVHRSQKTCYKTPILHRKSEENTYFRGLLRSSRGRRVEQHCKGVVAIVGPYICCIFTSKSSSPDNSQEATYKHPFSASKADTWLPERMFWGRGANIIFYRPSSSFSLLLNVTHPLHPFISITKPFGGTYT